MSGIISYVLCLLLPLQILAQNRGPDQLIQAAVFAERAHTEMPSCLALAGAWLSKAAETARRFHSPSKGQQETAGVLLAELDLLRAQIKEMERANNKLRHQASQALDLSRASTALTLLDETRGTTCSESTEELRRRAEASVHDAESLMAQGDAEIERYDPKAAIRLYTAALKADTETEGLAAKLAHAQELRNAQGSTAAAVGKGIAKGLLYTVLVGALGGAAYYVYKQSQKDQKNQ